MKYKRNNSCRTLLNFALVCFVFVAVSSVSAQEFEERLTQEQFAVEVVKGMKLDGMLPLAAIASDCVDLLEQLGISPMAGWDNKAYLTKEDYLVILNKAKGKEDLVHKHAVEVENKIIDEINKIWQESYKAEGRWLSLDELLANKKYFPYGPPKGPYGHKYQDADGDHKVDHPFTPIVGLMKLRRSISGFDEILP